MPDNNEPLTDHLLESSPPHQNSTTDRMQKKKDPARRLLFYEVLLEEYETHRPPDEEPDECDAEKVRQPMLDADSINSIRVEGDSEWAECEKIKDENERAAYEANYNGDLTSRFFTLLAKGQKTDSEKKFKELTEKYKASLQEEVLKRLAEGQLTGKFDGGLIAEGMAIADIYGLFEEYEEKVKKKERKAGDGEIQQSEVSIKEAAYGQLLEDLRHKCGGAEGNGPTNGNSESDDGSHTVRWYDSTDEAKRAYARTERSALCLSGGGIRSATFNLGILQGLARHGLLDQFDYLSTVSGGGFIGSWLTAWLHRSGTDKVIEGLTTQPPTPIEPEPHPINHLRIFSNYLSPRPGLLSADTWTLIATVLRNLMLTWLVFIPFLLAALALPRMWVALISPPTFINNADMLGWSFGLAVITGWIGLTSASVFLLRKSPPSNLAPYKNREAQFLLLCLSPLVVSAIALAVYWERLYAQLHRDFSGYTWWDFAAFAFLLIALPWGFTAIYRFVAALWRNWRTPTDATREYLWRIGKALAASTVLIILIQLIIGILLYVVFTKVLPLLFAGDLRLFASLSVPLLLGVISLDCTLIAGLTSRFTKDDDMEWWARAGAWLLITITVWAASHLLVLFGPSVILLTGYTWHKVREGSVGGSDFMMVAGQVITILTGIISGIITLAGGFSEKTPATPDETRRAGKGGKLTAILPSLLAPFFLAFLVILLAVVTNLLLTAPFMVGLSRWLFSTGEAEKFIRISAWDHAGLITQTPLRHLLMFGLIAIILGLVMGRLINTNKFSLHYMWSNRITRAYLGASRERRNPQSFTGFDNDDNLYLCELRKQPQEVAQEVSELMQVLCKERAATAIKETEQKWPRKLFHVLNVALNLAGGDKLAWQDRKAESFTFSPLHAGSYWLGYRRSFAYCGERDYGVSLGTAVAISGAFVSPNMGYLMTSPVVRFLMTLFNVRFGWWLGNPGHVGGQAGLIERVLSRLLRRVGLDLSPVRPFERKAPRLSVRPIIEEAFGKTDDKAPYVYLSDGGHFENLGLYEMVLRRCRFIVVCDASTDADYNFQALAQSIRQIRVDLGVPIDIDNMSITSPSQDLKGKYCAIGRIRYSCVDRTSGNPAQAGMTDQDFDGTLVYIKASMIGGEPRDVVNYGLGSKSFPQEIIVDQWFSEAQFESYRALGSHIIDIICGGDQNKIKMAAFERKAKEHNQIDFRVYNERISYAALANGLRKTMSRKTFLRYEERVKKYLKEILD